MDPVPAEISLASQSSVPRPISSYICADTPRIRVRFPKPVTGVSPGQVLAVYHRDQCLGSAVIRHTRTLGEVLEHTH